jgi:RNA 3'-terminal phosphate cyclase (ATP)
LIEIDGSRYSGSGTLVRQAIVFSALTGQSVHIVNARARRPKPGLRAQHVRVVEALRELVNATAEGVAPGSQEVIFRPGAFTARRQFRWDIGSAGSTTNLALAILPVLAFAPRHTQVELRGGLFQDFAPSFYHLQHVMLPLLLRMGLEAEVTMIRPGYVPRGEGIVSLSVKPLARSLESVVRDKAGVVERVWGIALSSHLEERRVSHRMADAATEVLEAAGYQANIEIINDTTALQPGAGLAVFADLQTGARLGADQAGAPGRPAEFIGHHVAGQMLEDLEARATVDRHVADQVIPFAALAAGTSRFRIPAETQHMASNMWLVAMFFGVQVKMENQVMTVNGVEYRRGAGRH